MAPGSVPLDFRQVPGDRFPRPDWAAADARASAAGTADLDAVYSRHAQEWVDRLQPVFGPAYRVHRREGWLLLSHERERYVDLLWQTLQRARRHISRALAGLAGDEGYGPHVLLLVESLDDYYDYVSHFYPAGSDQAFSMSAGMFVDDGYGHLIIPHRELAEVEAVAVHELTHAMLRDAELPLWLDEGIAVNIEQALSGHVLYPVEPALIGRLIGYWREHGLEAFWSGEAFSRPDEGSELSYALAAHVVSALGDDYPRFRRFARAAQVADAGEAAAQQVYGTGLGAVMSRFLGDGDWAPGATRAGMEVAR